jgi:hypothetical protein
VLREGVNAAVGCRALADEFRSWNRDVLFAYFDVGNKTRLAAVDVVEVETLLRDAVVSGSVVGVDDFTIPGGCSFDFTDRGDGEAELLVACWGSKESVADRLLSRFPAGVIFSGN